jgi:SAM-dependent methyltransferase
MNESTIILSLIQDIKKKKELAGLDESIARRELKDYFLKNKKALSRLVNYQIEKQLKKSAEYEKALKAIRANLHESYGMFQVPKNAEEIKQHFLRKLHARQLTEDDYKLILSSHLSTKERIGYYPFIYQQIFKIIKPKIILDLGCGLNPVSAHYMNCKARYIASDIDRKNLDFIQQFFDLSGIDGKTQVIDLETESDIQKLAFISADVCFLFKLLEIDKRTAENIVSAIDAKVIVASFSTINLKGEIMSSPEREWFEKMLSRLKYKFTTFKTENEIFYVIHKS